jgi:membrane protein YqaA with SNARE-associated domain
MNNEDRFFVSWGTVVIDSIIIICSVISRNYWLLILIIFTGKIVYDRKENDE